MYIDYLSNSRTNGMNTGREYLTIEELAVITKREFDSSRLEKSPRPVPVRLLYRSGLSRHQELAAIQHHYSKGRYTLVINWPTDAQQSVANPPYWKTPVKSSTSTKTMEQRIFCPFRASKRSTPT